MQISNNIPEWHGHDRDSGGHRIPFTRATLAEFCGRFGLTREKALSEIRRCKIWTCEPYGSSKLFLNELEPSIIPLAEFDRYEAIIAAEKLPKPKRKSTMDEGHKAAKAKFEEAYRSIVKPGKKPKEVDVLKHLKEMSAADDELFVFPSKKRFEYAGTEIDYSTYKHWLTALNK